MANIIFLSAIILETAYVINCFSSNQEHSRVRNTMRLGAFAVFVILSGFSVLQWSFRWYLLAVLLFIWAAIGKFSQLRRKNETVLWKPASRILKSTGTLLLIALALAPAWIFPQFKLPPPSGPHPVKTASFTYTDPSRVETFSKEGGNRMVNVEFWYPADGEGEYPLVVFSHGAFGMKKSNTSTFQNLASSGYVVCSIDHPYHSMFTMDDQRRVTVIDQTFLQQVSDLNNGKIDDETSFPIKQAWMQVRTADMNFVLDTILSKSGLADTGEVYRLVDAERIGLMGHSLGGATSAQVARERDDIDAVINLDGDLMGEYLDAKNTLNQETFPAPILSIFTDDFTTRLSEIPNPEQAVAAKYVTLLSEQGYEVVFSGANHMYMTDLPLISPAMVALINRSSNLVAGGADPYTMIEEMNNLVLRFFDATLKGQGTFQP